MRSSEHHTLTLPPCSPVKFKTTVRNVPQRNRVPVLRFIKVVSREYGFPAAAMADFSQGLPQSHAQLWGPTSVKRDAELLQAGYCANRLDCRCLDQIAAICGMSHRGSPS